MSIAQAEPTFPENKEKSDLQKFGQSVIGRGCLTPMHRRRRRRGGRRRSWGGGGGGPENENK
jgi:hypothetical protein